MIIHNLPWKNNKLFAVYLAIAIFLFYNIQTFSYNSEKFVYNVPPSYQETEQKENISVSDEVTKERQSPSPAPSTASQADRVWITMGLCWGENAQVYGKSHFPYSEAALRSVQLWHHLTEARVVITIVHTGQPSPSLSQYRRQLEQFGASVSVVVATELSCVLTSQLIRLVPQEHHPIIRDNDVIVTADVDAFPMTADILLPLKKQSSVSAWVWRYELSYTNGYTFMMPFIGARSKTWQEIIWYNGSLAATVSHYKSLLNMSQEAEFWDTDQDIVTYSLVANKDCNNVLWQRNAMIKYYGKDCKWWHFYPYEGKKELEEKFREIMDGSANNNFLDKLITGAAAIKKNVLDKFLTVEKKYIEDPAGELEIWSDHVN